METRRWTNPTQPQTLQIAVFLLYINAVFGVVFGEFLSPAGVFTVPGAAIAAYFIANERRWGYWLGVAVAGTRVVVLVVQDGGLAGVLNFSGIFGLIFPVALLALLLHPHSRDYQRIWFS